ncbi:SDR family NAD(P)-dependent oxidoreductase [Paenibacillus sp. NFR01]|uniref:SDR family NAD(P)-dependent oxidoreductase n=1 Tax=Paenibacillus sp. NFR01 TaxID=1566279 RepID=UPI0008C54466|nr:SDR family NAD(P)-dependent oxidoreductase [Paenibacillus sp. NFR01]SET53719.1 NAD(P)-dependent dehydrogenase, short-chain alcohol dehydrogenase family [Paenibacillus sp. NFR01]
MKSLHGTVALVTGASRGAGRGIALELAKAGAYVYVTGRSSEASPDRARKETVEAVIAEMKQLGGEGAAIVCDHTVDADTAAAIRRIGEEQGRLDLLVNNAWGGNQLPIDLRPMWEQPAGHWDNMFTAGVRAQLMTNRYAIPLMRSGGTAGKLIVHTTYWEDYKYLGNFYYDLSKNALVRMAYGLSRELAADGIAVIPVSPGWMRTELVLESLNTDEVHWKGVAELSSSESTFYIGRAVAALAADPEIMRLTGIPQQVGKLAELYGFTDVDGRRVPPFAVPE